MNIAIIPARSGSKRLPGKNIKEFHGQPIIKYSIDVALKSKLFERVEVSTDDNHIGNIAAHYGAVYSRARDEELSGDDVPMVNVLMDILKYHKREGREYEYCCMIYPCAPFLTVELLKSGYSKLKSGYDVVFPVYEDSAHAERSMIIRADKIQSRYPEHDNQNSNNWPITYQHAGQYFWANCEALLKNKTLMPESKCGIIVDALTSIDIDTREDWEKAELIYQMLHDRKDDWIEKRKRLIAELMIAEDVVRFGKIVLKYQDGSYLDMDLHPTMKIAEIKKC